MKYYAALTAIKLISIASTALFGCDSELRFEVMVNILTYCDKVADISCLRLPNFHNRTLHPTNRDLKLH